MSAVPADLRPWTRAEYLRASELGLFRPDERLELLDGQIYLKMTQNPPHVIALENVLRVFFRIAGEEFRVRSQGPFALDDLSQPEPDVLIAPGDARTYLNEHPAPDQVALIIEISDATLDRDRRVKVPLYARAGIREIWIVDVNARRLEAYREPTPEGYRSTTIRNEVERLAPLFRPEIMVEVASLLPPQ